MAPYGPPSGPICRYLYADGLVSSVDGYAGVQDGNLHGAIGKTEKSHWGISIDLNLITLGLNMDCVCIYIYMYIYIYICMCVCMCVYIYRDELKNRDMIFGGYSNHLPSILMFTMLQVF